MRNKFFVSLLLIIAIVSTSAFALTSSGACAIDVESGNILYEYNADTPLAPASMTKVMTAYIIYDKLKSGVFTKDTYIPCSENVAALSKDPDATNVPLIAGEMYSIDELLYAIMLPSACAACTLIGEYISGSEAEFAKLMNEYAKNLGLDAYFEDASGLSDNNRITPRSMAQLGALFIREYPDILHYTCAKSFSFRGKTYNNTNQLLSGKDFPYEGADGLKTGTTTLAGKCLTATAERDSVRIVGVTMHSTSTSSRYTDMHEILDNGFSAVFNMNNTLYANTASIFINNKKIPSYYCGNNDGESIIMAADLKNYGFDVQYDFPTNTVYIRREKQNDFSPINDNLTGNSIYAMVDRESNIKIKLNNDGYYYTFKKVFDADGRAGILVDELKNVFKYKWIDSLNSGYLSI